MLEGLFQPLHLPMILGIALVVFGPARLPELGKGLGEAIRGFKGAIQGESHPAPRPPLEAQVLLASAPERAERGKAFPASSMSRQQRTELRFRELEGRIPSYSETSLTEETRRQAQMDERVRIASAVKSREGSG